MMPSAALAQRESAVMLDGDLVTVIATGDRLEVLYIEPPVLLREAGAVKGSPVLKGNWSEGVLIGNAYMYAPGCSPISYPIRAIVDANLNLIVVGPTPRLVMSTCTVDGYEWSEKSIFKLGQPMTTKRQEPKKKKAREAKSEPKPKPKPPRQERAPQQPQQQWNWREQWRW